MNKTELRKKFKEIRKNIIPHNITPHIFGIDIYKNASAVFSFVSCGTEIGTRHFIETALRDNKIVAVPLMRDKGEMVFIKIGSLAELEPNRYGIPEPKYDTDKILTPNKGTLIAVPGLAFDKNGYRLGYGGGYYDRYLKGKEYMAALGFCYEKQITDSLPYDEYDIAVDGIATERRII